MNHLKRFLWQFDMGTSYEGLKIGIASIIPGLGLWASGYPKYALLTVIAFAISVTAFILFPGTVLWYVLCIIWMAQMFIAVALEELKVLVEPDSPIKDFPNTKNSITLPCDLPKGKRLFAYVKQELTSRLPAYNRLVTYVAGIEDKTSQCWFVGLTEDELILVSSPQPGATSHSETIPRTAISWTYLLVARRNHLLSIEYKLENSEETQAFLLHVPGSWHKQALVMVKELPGTWADESAIGVIERLLPRDSEFQLLFGAFSIVGIGLLFITFLIRDIFFPKTFFGLPGDILPGLGFACLVYLMGWPFALQVIHIFRKDPAAIITQGFASSGFVLIAPLIWLFAIFISHRTVIMEIISR